MSELKVSIDAEAKAAETAKADQESVVRSDVKVTCGHDRSKTSQIRPQRGRAR